MKYKFLILIFSFFVIKAHALNPYYSTKIEALKLYEDPQWLLLNHYHKNIFGNYESDITGEHFFMAKDGASDPKSEMRAALDVLLKDPVKDYVDPNENPYCLMKARGRWLKNKLDIEDRFIKKAQCPIYNHYVSTLNAESVSFVFSSYYANNPGSAFGHTFFKINKKTPSGEPSSELLDHGIGYAADANTNNALIYAIYGFTGLFRGSYSNVPYYYKVREYNDYESRDLWAYNLNLDDNELALLIDHLWEIGNSSFDYYFLSENCAYEMLAALEAAAPRFHLLERTRFYVIPSDSIKTIMTEPGLVESVSFRPSARSVFFAKYDTLTSDEKLEFKNFVKHNDLSMLIDHPIPASQVHLLDLGIDYLDYKYPILNVSEKNPHNDLKQEILKKRAEIPIASEPFEVKANPKDQPDLGHKSGRLGFTFGNQDGVGVYDELEARFALNDVLDNPDGYPYGSQLEFAKIKGRYNWKNKQSYLTDLEIFKVADYNPLNAFSNKLSWRFELGGHRFEDGSCNYCFASGIEGAGGYSININGNKSYIAYGLISAQGYYADAFIHSYKLAAGPTLGVFILPNETFRLNIDGTYFVQANSTQDPYFLMKNELRYNFSKAATLGLAHMILKNNTQVGLTGYYYF